MVHDIPDTELETALVTLLGLLLTHGNVRKPADGPTNPIEPQQSKKDSKWWAKEMETPSTLDQKTARRSANRAENLLSRARQRAAEEKKCLQKVVGELVKLHKAQEEYYLNSLKTHLISAIRQIYERVRNGEIDEDQQRYQIRETVGEILPEAIDNYCLAELLVDEREIVERGGPKECALFTLDDLIGKSRRQMMNWTTRLYPDFPSEPMGRRALKQSEVLDYVRRVLDLDESTT